MKGVIVAAILAGGFYLAHLIQNNSTAAEIVGNYGYFGAFIISIIGGLNLVVPVPAVAFLPVFLESGLNFWFLILIMGIGVTLADSVAFFVGKLGHEFAHHAGHGASLRWVRHVRERHPLAPFFAAFFFSVFVPLPNEILMVPLGFLGYRFVYIFPIVLVGNLFFHLLYATGTLGILHIF